VGPAPRVDEGTEGDVGFGRTNASRQSPSYDALMVGQRRADGKAKVMTMSAKGGGARTHVVLRIGRRCR
jgi:hypothetical protein